MNHLTCIYFSATSTTRRCVEAVTKAFDLPVKRSYNLADNIMINYTDFTPDDIVIIGMPVYGGRIPEYAVEQLRNLKGNGAPAIAMVIYGNRDYDDALLELYDLLVNAGFNIAATGAFIGQHSIFPKVGTGRPDKSDQEKLAQFGDECRDRINCGLPYASITPKGNRPYKKYGGVPFIPHCNLKKCRECETCAEKCPVGAINSVNMDDTDVTKCMTCGRCIYVCPHRARGYSGFKYIIIGAIFKAAFSKRKEPEWIIAE